MVSGGRTRAGARGVIVQTEMDVVEGRAAEAQDVAATLVPRQVVSAAPGLVVTGDQRLRPGPTTPSSGATAVSISRWTGGGGSAIRPAAHQRCPGQLSGPQPARNRLIFRLRKV